MSEDVATKSVEQTVDEKESVTEPKHTELGDSAPPSKKRKKKASKNNTIAQFTLRNPDWAYLHLALITQESLNTSEIKNENNSNNVDELTVYMHIQSALKQYLGLQGTAIPFDILKTKENQVWISVPREDISAMMAAVGGWIGSNGQGWRTLEWSSWGPADGDNGQDLFGD